MRGEAGFVNAFFSGGGFFGPRESGFISSIYFAAEPRWYYNLKKRKRKEKNYSYNSGNYIGLQLTYVPKWITISNLDAAAIDRDHNLILASTFGMRRNLGKYFDFELGLGIGYGIIFDGSENYFFHGFGIFPHLRLGFKK